MKQRVIKPKAPPGVASRSGHEILDSAIAERLSQVIRELSGDPQEVWSQIAEDIKATEQAGIPQELILDAFKQPDLTI